MTNSEQFDHWALWQEWDIPSRQLAWEAWQASRHHALTEAANLCSYQDVIENEWIKDAILALRDRRS